MLFFVGEAPESLLRSAGRPFAALLPAPFVEEPGVTPAPQVVCPRRGVIDSAPCADCPHLVSAAPGGLECRARGSDPVVTWMTPAPRLVVIAPEVSCAEARVLARAARVHHLLVLDGKRALVGIACACDLAREGGGPLARVMSRDVFVTGPSTALSEALAIMNELGIGCLPIVDNGILRGVVTRTDLGRAGAR
jgi:CBS-domain-containing membrane protein